ncbi:MAG: WxL domain-containing protein [Actinomycetota bacterium]
MGRKLLVVGVVFVALSLPMAAFADTISGTLTGGTLSIATASFSFANTTLNGADQSVSANAASAWTAIDARGTGVAYSVTISATTPTSAAGTVESTARTLAVSDLAMTTGTITAGAGSDPASSLTGSTSLALSNSSQTLVSAASPSKGTYTFTPSVTLSIPANAYRSNYSGVVGSSSLNPYSSTMTVTIA